MNETPTVANIDEEAGMTNSIIKQVNANLPADYQLSKATTIADANLELTQSSGEHPTYVIYESAKTDAWGNPYYVVFDATERHDLGISDFYITVVSAGPNAQTKICQAPAVAPTATDKGIEADDLFLLVQYTDGDVAAATYNCANDALETGNGAALGLTKKGTATATTQGYYISKNLNASGLADLCPVNF